MSNIPGDLRERAGSLAGRGVLPLVSGRAWRHATWQSHRWTTSRREEPGHKVARVTHVRVKPDDIEEAVRLCDDSVVPAAEQEEGFMGALVLPRADGRALVVDLCDTVEHMRANERGGFYQTEVAKWADKLIDRPVREFYDVAVAKGVDGGAVELRRSA